MSIVSLRGLKKYFTVPKKVTTEPKRGAIDGLDLEIKAGEFFVLLGPSGCGKTTTLRCIAGLEDPTDGEIHIGEDVVAAPARHFFVPPEKRNVGMVFQSYALWPHMSVFDNVAYPLRRLSQKISKEELIERVGRALSLVGLEKSADQFPPDLSGGQQQRIALARAVVAKPRLLLFDEPLSNLDAQLRIRLRQDLRRIHDETGQTSIYVTHDQQEALALADRIAVMRLGRIEQLGTPTEIFLYPRTRFIADFVGYDNLFDGHVLAAENGVATVRVEGLNRPVVGRVVGDAQVGDKVTVAIRASRLKIEPKTGKEEAVNQFDVQVEQATYLGEHYQAQLRIGDKQATGSLAVAEYASWLANKATELVASVDVQDAVIIPEDKQTV